jgi:hypothetical protein
MTSKNRQTENKMKRVPVSGMRDILTVYGKDPAFEYRFVKDEHENGSRIARFTRGGWEFTRPDKHNQIIIGQEAVYKTEQDESIIRFPAGSGQFNYLMQIRKELYDEDQKTKQDNIDELESTMTGTRTSDDNELGQYGQIKITRD